MHSMCMYILENGFKEIITIKQARNVQPSLALGTVLLLLLRCAQLCGQAILLHNTSPFTTAHGQAGVERICRYLPVRMWLLKSISRYQELKEPAVSAPQTFTSLQGSKKYLQILKLRAKKMAVGLNIKHFLLSSF